MFSVWIHCQVNEPDRLQDIMTCLLNTYSEDIKYVRLRRLLHSFCYENPFPFLFVHFLYILLYIVVVWFLRPSCCAQIAIKTLSKKEELNLPAKLTTVVGQKFFKLSNMPSGFYKGIAKISPLNHPLCLSTGPVKRFLTTTAVVIMHIRFVNWIDMMTICSRYDLIWCIWISADVRSPNYFWKKPMYMSPFGSHLSAC